MKKSTKILMGLAMCATIGLTGLAVGCGTDKKSESEDVYIQPGQIEISAEMAEGLYSQAFLNSMSQESMSYRQSLKLWGKATNQISQITEGYVKNKDSESPVFYKKVNNSVSGVSEQWIMSEVSSGGHPSYIKLKINKDGEKQKTSYSYTEDAKYYALGCGLTLGYGQGEYDLGDGLTLALDTTYQKVVSGVIDNDTTKIVISFKYEIKSEDSATMTVDGRHIVTIRDGFIMGCDSAMIMHTDEQRVGTTIQGSLNLTYGAMANIPALPNVSEFVQV